MSARRAGRPAVPARTPRRRRSADLQRQRLIDACISALHVYGPSRTTVAKVVGIARLSPGIVRFYFKSKQAMLIASLQFLATEFADYMLEPVGRLRATPVQALQQLVERYLDPAISSPRKVSVWYAFWGEATARQEYLEICGQKDERFADLVHELIRRMIEQSGMWHLNADAIALGLIGVLEVIWQGFAFQSEQQIDRAGARRRCMAYLASVFPGYFVDESAPARIDRLPPEARFALEREQCFEPAWQLVGHEREIPASGDFLTLELATTRALVLRDGGELRAFHNSCPNQPHALAMARRGHFPGRIDCPLHQLSFSLLGQAVHPREAASLPALRVAVAGGFIFVGAGAAMAPLQPAAGFAAHVHRALDGAAQLTQLDVAANWKTAVEQLLLHRLPDHESIGGTLRFTPPRLEIDVQRRAVGWRASPVAAESWSAQRLAGLPGLAGAEGEWRRWFLWPNLLIELRPDGLGIMQVIPLAPRASRWQCFEYRYAEAGRAERALRFLAARLARRALRLDLELASSTERALGTPGYPIEGSAPLARPVAAFRAMLDATLRAGARAAPG